MSLTNLYREVILDHYRNPRNRGSLSDPDAHGEGHNPLCGDEIAIDLQLTGEVVSAVGITSQGCSISQSSASMMSEAIIGKTLSQIKEISETFNSLMTSDEITIDPERPGSILGELESLQGVREFPVRIKCAVLGWHTMLEALEAQ